MGQLQVHEQISAGISAKLEQSQLLFDDFLDKIGEYQESLYDVAEKFDIEYELPY